MKVTQFRVEDRIDFYAVVSGTRFLAAQLFDGHDDFIIDHMGDQMTLRLAKAIPADFRVVMPLTPEEARLIDAMPVPDASA